MHLTVNNSDSDLHSISVTRLFQYIKIQRESRAVLLLFSTVTFNYIWWTILALTFHNKKHFIATPMTDVAGLTNNTEQYKSLKERVKMAET